jgi:hypothetical protein
MAEVEKDGIASKDKNGDTTTNANDDKDGGDNTIIGSNTSNVPKRDDGCVLLSHVSTGTTAS